MLSLADAILAENFESVRQILHYGEDVNQLDEYGFTPLIEAAIVENLPIAKFLLEQGANPNQQDTTGGSPLQWAVENNNLELCQLLFAYQANPNIYNFAGQPALVMSLLRQQTQLKSLLLQAGADLQFAQDFINTKLLGHMFELMGTANIVTPNKQFVEVDFEGFFLETTLAIISDSLTQFQNHFAARQLRRYAGLSNFIVQVIKKASALIKYQQYRVDIDKYQSRINNLLMQEPILIPVGYEGHAITFIKYDDIWVKCDRREDSRLYDNIMFYRIGNRSQANDELIKKLIYTKNDSRFINVELDHLLKLQPYTELKVEAQISGNCSWANVEATVPALFFLVLMKMNPDENNLSYFKTLALNYFHRWREWNKDRALHSCIRNFEEGNPMHKACKAEILAAILFQRCDLLGRKDKERIEMILSLFLNSPFEYILKNYLRVYYYEGYTEKGKQFAQLLKDHGFS